MSLTICVPLRCADSYRLRNWKVVYHHLAEVCKRHDLPMVVAECGGQHATGLECTRVDVPIPWGNSKSRNVAWQHAETDRICFADADFVMPMEAWDVAIERSADFDCYSPNKRKMTLGPKQTWNRLDGHVFQFDRPRDLPTKRGNLFGQISFCTRQFLQDIGGWDERFQGWGYEDTAIEKLANVGGYSIGFDDFVPIHLYHTRRQRVGAKATHRLYQREYAGRSFADILTRRGVEMPIRNGRRMIPHRYESIHGWFDFADLYSAMIDRFPSGHFVEVGSWKGKSAAYMAVEIANSSKPIVLDCVDHFHGTASEGQHRLAKDIDLAKVFASNLGDFDFVRQIQMPSVDASTLYDDRSLDFVFIDAAHDEANVTADIAAWLPKVRPGGVIAGHDYTRRFPGVVAAVKKLIPLASKASNSCWMLEV